MQAVIIDGNVGRDAELRNMPDGTPCASFTVAVRDPINRDQTNWFRCDYYGKRGEAVQPYIKKGTYVYLTGSMSIGEYEGKTTHKVRVSELSFVNKDRDAAPAPARKPTAHDEAKRNGYQPQHDLEDSIPF